MAIYHEPYLGIPENKVPHLYTMHYYLEDGYNHVLFKCGQNIHRTDGPALIRWNYRETKLFYIRGNSWTEDRFMEVYNAPIEQLPLWINHMYLKDIAIDRLAAENTSVIIGKKSEGIHNQICQACNLDPKRVIIRV